MSIVLAEDGSVTSTVLDIISSALRKIRVLGAGETPSSEDAEDCMIALNEMLDTWGSEIGPLHVFSTDTHTLTAGTGSYTIGLNGDINTTRPIDVNVLGSFTRDSGGTDYYFNRRLSQQEYNQIADKTPGNSYPYAMFYDPTYERGTIYIYPTPSSGLTLHLLSAKPFTAYNDIYTVFSLPPGYKQAVIYNLAVEIAEDFGKAASPAVVRKAMMLKGTLEARNHAQRLSAMKLGIPTGNRGVVKPDFTPIVW